MDTCYSVAIRTVRDNEYLRRCLKALEKQTVRPAEIILVIPDDVQPWDTCIDCVRFVHDKRGMVTQRAGGIRAANHRHLLLLDDDVVIAPNTAELLLTAMRERNAVCVIPYWAEGWPKGIFLRFFMSFWGIAIPRSNGGIRYTAGGGYYYPAKEPTEPWVTEGGSGAILLVNRNFCLNQQCLGDVVFQDVSVYALREDGAFIFDIYQKGGLCLMIGGISFEHLGGTTRLDPSRLEMSYRALIYNHYLFWRKYIYSQHNRSFSNRIKSRLSYYKYLAGSILLSLMSACRSMRLQPLRGLIAGLHLIFSKPSVMHKDK